MRDRKFLTTARALLAALALLIFTGCHSSGVNGIYKNPTGEIAIDFEDGKAAITMGPTTEDPVPYEVNGNKITVHAGGGNGDLVFTQESDGSLQADMGMMGKVVLTKK